MTLRFIAALATAVSVCVSCSTAPRASRARPTAPLVLISIDGLRWDHSRAFEMRELESMARDGATALGGMIPVYPSKTFPNHYSIATGCYVDRNGLVSNEFFDPILGKSYGLGDRAAVMDGSWYGCDPIWNVVERSGERAATFFWVGSDAAVGGQRPSDWRAYDASVSNDVRIDQALKWLKASRPPRLVTLYFSDVDSAAHKHGPLSAEARAAAQSVDASLARLRSGLREAGVEANLIVVSDHGMSSTDQAKVVWLDEVADLAGFIIKSGGPQMHLYADSARFPTEPARLEASRALRDRLRKLKVPWRVWLRAEIPAALRIGANPRAGDLLIDMDAKWSVQIRARADKIPVGNHGWDPEREPEMRGSFFAVGPAFQAGVRVASFRNVDLFNLMARVMGVEGDVAQGSAGNDGSLDSPVFESLKGSTH